MGYFDLQRDRGVRFPIRKWMCFLLVIFFLLISTYGNDSVLQSSQEKIIILFEGEPIKTPREREWWDNSFGWITKGEKKLRTLTFINQTNEDISFTCLPESTDEVIVEPAQFVLKANDTTFCNVILQPQEKNSSDHYSEYIDIESSVIHLKLDVNYWYQSDYRKIVVWKDKTSYESIDANNLQINDIQIPKIINGRMYLEAKFFPLLGYIFQLHIQKNIAATLRIDENTLYFESGKDTVVINGEPVPIDNKLDIIHDMRMFLPIRFLAEYAGYEVMWDPAEEKVTLLWDKLEDGK
jgi:hypothetical protein